MDDIDRLLLNKGIAAMLPQKEEKEKGSYFCFHILNYEIKLYFSVKKRR